MLEAKQRGKLMPDHKVRNRRPEKQRVRRIPPKEAAKIFKQCESFLADSSELLKNLPEAGFGQLLAQIDETILRLAIQPDSWGERTRARLMSEIAAALRGNPADRDAVSVEDIVSVSNIVTPCFLLELGRRKQHLQIEFPSDPADPSARFRVGVGASHKIHSINNDQFQALVARAGEELVGLCYFGDRESRERIEAELSLATLPAA
jgi:hypothetical protein